MRKAGMKIEIREKRTQVNKAKSKGEICSEEVTQAKQKFIEKVIKQKSATMTDIGTVWARGRESKERKKNGQTNRQR